MLAAMFAASIPVHAQQGGKGTRRTDTTHRTTRTTTKKPKPPVRRDSLAVDTNRVRNAVPDSSLTPRGPLDSMRVDSLAGDSLAVGVDQSGVDTVIPYSARDIVFDADDMQLELLRNAELRNGAMDLKADYIRVDFRRSELHATAAYDSATKRYTDVPILHDGTQELTANSLTYNFKTRRGTLAAAETKLGDGFYYGAHIKQVAPNTYFVQDGTYTTCTAPHPHYYFSSPRMKVIAGDRVFADQVALYVSDVPIMYIPFGVYFPGKTGRQSGLIIPQFSQTSQRGFTLENIGFFWDINDYVDTRFNADLYSKGGYTFRNATRFRMRGVIEQSDLNLTYGRTRDDVDADYTESYIVDYSHQMPVGRRGRLGGSLHFLSQNAIRNTTTRPNLNDTYNSGTSQNVTSDFSYSTSWNWGSLSAGYNRTQNILNNNLLQSAPLTINFPSISPFASAPEESLLSRLNVSVGGSIAVRSEFEKRDTLPGGGYRINDERYGSTLQPTISISPRLGYVNVTPSISYTGSIFTRRIVKEARGDTIGTYFVHGLRYTNTYSASLSLATSLYGILQPRVLGINAIRHTLSPVLTFSYAPDFGKKSFGYYDEFFNPITNAVERYSVFERDASVAAAPGGFLQQMVTLLVRNEFEMKVAQGDTLPDRKVRLLSLSLSTSYNAAAPNNIRWSPISASANTELGTIGYLSGSATLDIYDRDTLGATVPFTLLERGLGLVRMQSANISFGTNFSDQGFTTGSAAAVADSAAARRARFDFEHVPFNDREFYGEDVRGDANFRVPWQIGITGSYTITRDRFNEMQTSFTLNTTFGFSLTPTMRISSSGSYNFDQGKFLIPTISMTKDLECWEMRFDWTPSGYSKGFYFRIGLKAPQLQDVKLERRRYYYE